MYCPSCGKSIADGSAFCMHCGKPTGLTAQPAAVPTNAVAQPNAPICPNCHQMDAVRHTAGVIAEGVVGQQTTTYSSGQSVGIGVARSGSGGAAALAGTHYSGVSHSEGIAMTALAAKLTELRLRQASTPYVLPSMPPEPPRPGWIYWDAEIRFRCTLLTGGFDTRWKDLYYCSRCAGAFVLGESEFASLDKLEQLLYRYPTVIDHDFCELQDGLVKGGMSGRRVLIAMAYGTKGVYIVRELRWNQALYQPGTGVSDRDHRNRLIISHANPNCRPDKANYDTMLSDLQAAGRVKLNEQGELWYQARFILPHKNQLAPASP